jgi:4-hydroxy-tetrahydrodipicolinate synthase
MDYSVGCPMVTPFDADGRLDTASLRSLVDHLVDGGVDRLVPCGTTGEFASLTDEEHRTVVETTVDAADGRATVMAGVGGTAVADVRDRIAAAAEAGADSALVVAPYYGGQADPDGNEQFFDAVAAGADLPLYLYNIPGAAGQSIAVETVESLAERGRYDGIKDSSGDLTFFDELLARTPETFDVLQGWDAQYVPSLLMGGDGGISAGTHLRPGAFVRAGDAVADDDVAVARAEQFDAIDPVFRPCMDDGFAPVCKALLAERGVVETDTVRPPLVPVPGDDRRELADTLAD